MTTSSHAGRRRVLRAKVAMVVGTCSIVLAAAVACLAPSITANSSAPAPSPPAYPSSSSASKPFSPSAATLPMRAMFYYPWFGETWYSNDHYVASLGRYSSDDPAVVAKQVEAMRYAGIQAAIASWWGRGEHAERSRFPRLYAGAAAQGLGVIPYYEREGYADPSVAEIQADLAYLEAYINAYPGSAVRLAGKPVIFVYNAGASGCADVTRWKQATNGFTTWYVNMKVFEGFRSCLDQPSSWHQYGPAVAESVHLPWSFNISPGFWHHDEISPRLARDPARWSANVARLAASGAQWQLVTSFNEWGEGTAVESSPSWRSPTGWGGYLDELHRQLADHSPTTCHSVAVRVVSGDPVLKVGTLATPRRLVG